MIAPPLRPTLLALALLALAGCTSGLSPDSLSTSQCASPLQGKRYAVCARFTTLPFAAASGPLQVIGSVNSGTERSSSGRYTLTGGTFHASH